MSKKPYSPVKAFWTTREIAEHLGVCERTVRRWIDSGDLISHKFGRRIRISKADFVAFIHHHRDANHDFI